MTKQELQTRKNELATQIRAKADAFNANGKSWKDDAERQAFAQLNTDYEQVNRDLQAAVEADDVASRLQSLTDDEARSRNAGAGLPGREDTGHRRSVTAGDGPDEETRARALRAFFRDAMDEDISDDDIAAMRACRMRPGRRSLNLILNPTETVRSWSQQLRSGHPSRVLSELGDHRSQRAQLEARALNTYTFGSGGALVPSSLVRTIEINMLAFGGMRQVAETIVTGQGGEMAWPTGDDTSNEGARLGEAVAQPTPVDPSFSRVVWRDYKYTSKPVKVDQELLEDSAFDLASMIGAMLGERIGRKTNRDFTTSEGGGNPRGIVPAATVGRTTSGAITFDDVLRLEHSVDPAYRIGSWFMCHDTILLALKLLKDSVTGQYLWQNGIDIGQQDRLHGAPLTINQHMASTTSVGDDVLLYGQFSKYKIRRVRSARLYRLEELYRENDQDGFILMVREDGNLLDAGTAPVKKMRIGS